MTFQELPELLTIKQASDFLNVHPNTLRNWEKNGRAQKLVLSFHGVPKRTLMLGDPYHCECYKTARLLREELGLSTDELLVTFQSRFGKAEWLQPYTAPTLEKLAHEGLQRVDVMCPGFTSDCLETLEEISLEAKQEFLLAGGKEFHYIPCLNDSPSMIAALANITARQLQGWRTRLTPADADGLRQQREIGAAEAKRLGA